MIAVSGLAIRQGSFSLTGIDFEVPAGHYAVLNGRTGSGKTTLLETIAGLHTPAAGTILLRGQDVTRLTPAERTLGYVPQDAAVFQSMTVRENLSFGLEVRRAPDVTSRVAELASWLGLTSLLDRQAVDLSGGEAQRIALGRALAFRPDILLLDEPLSAVDESTRDELLELLTGLRKTGGVTVLHVTHSRTEAERLGDLIFSLDRGAIVAVK